MTVCGAGARDPTNSRSLGPDVTRHPSPASSDTTRFHAGIPSLPFIQPSSKYSEFILYQALPPSLGETEKPHSYLKIYMIVVML